MIPWTPSIQLGGASLDQSVLVGQGQGISDFLVDPKQMLNPAKDPGLGRGGTIIGGKGSTGLDARGLEHVEQMLPGGVATEKSQGCDLQTGAPRGSGQHWLRHQEFRCGV